VRQKYWICVFSYHEVVRMAHPCKHWNRGHQDMKRRPWLQALLQNRLHKLERMLKQLLPWIACMQRMHILPKHWKNTLLYTWELEFIIPQLWFTNSYPGENRHEWEEYCSFHVRNPDSSWRVNSVAPLLGEIAKADKIQKRPQPW